MPNDFNVLSYSSKLTTCERRFTVGVQEQSSEVAAYLWGKSKSQDFLNRMNAIHGHYSSADCVCWGEGVTEKDSNCWDPYYLVPPLCRFYCVYLFSIFYLYIYYVYFIYLPLMSLLHLIFILCVSVCFNNSQTWCTINLKKIVLNINCLLHHLAACFFQTKMVLVYLSVWFLNIVVMYKLLAIEIFTYLHSAILNLKHIANILNRQTVAKGVISLVDGMERIVRFRYQVMWLISI